MLNHLTMLPVQDAENLILKLAISLTETENLPLKATQGRILAQDIQSSLDFPYWDNSAMDGYAVRYEDVKAANENNPVTLKIISEIPAGLAPKTPIHSQEAARIFTGAMIPFGADTIIMQENTQRDGNQVKILIAPEKPSQFVRRKGAYYKAGNPLLKAGILLNASKIAVLATAQCATVTVYRQPKVAIFSTGNELVSPETPLQTGQIVDSNQYALGAFVQSQGAIPILMGIVPDNKNILAETIQKAINQADIVLSTGGVSVGDYDYVEALLRELGGKIEISSVAMKPGKPLTVAKFNNNCLYFGIPGNPVSALVSCWRLVQPALKKCAGLSENYQPQWLKAQLQQPLKSTGKRETYYWGQLKLISGSYVFLVARGHQNSANLINLANINALAMLPIGTTVAEKGETVNVMIIN
jgi:molybdopterin molybdotransferase